MIKRFIVIILAIGTCFSPVVQAQQLQRLVIGDQKGDWGGLAPYLHIARGPGYIYTSFIFDSLTWKDEQGEHIPLLAQSWSSDAEKLHYTFELKPNLTWHDGKALTAKDVQFTFDYMVKHPYKFVNTKDVQSVSVDVNKVIITLKKPSPLFIEQIASVLPILPEHIYAQVEDPSRFSNPKAFIGSGAYKLKQYKRTQGFYYLVSNNNWALGVPRYKEVIINRQSLHSAVEAMGKGEVHAMSIPFSFVELFKEHGATIVQMASNHPYRLLFNHHQRFDKKAYRQGIAHAINRKQLVELAYQNSAYVARTSYRQQGTTESLNPYTYSPQKAQQILSDAGWTKNAAGQWLDSDNHPIKLTLITSKFATQLSKVLTQQLSDFGFEINLRILQDVELTNALVEQDFDLALLTQSHAGDVDRFRTMLTGARNRGDNYHQNKELLSLLQAYRFELDAQKREIIILEAERLYNEDLPSFILIDPINYGAKIQHTHADFTQGGVAMGVPMMFNKSSLFK